MTQPEALQQATERLDVAIDDLEGFLRDILADGEGGDSIAELREQVRFLTEERDRLQARSRRRKEPRAAAEGRQRRGLRPA